MIAAIQRAIALKTVYNIRVINLSLGRPVSASYKNDRCAKLSKRHGSPVSSSWWPPAFGRDNSAGTQGYSTITAPGNDPYVITVGAMNTLGTLTINDDRVTSYSSKGPTLIDHVSKPDLVGPGTVSFPCKPKTVGWCRIIPATVFPSMCISRAATTGTKITSNSAAPAWPLRTSAQPLPSCYRPIRA